MQIVVVVEVVELGNGELVGLRGGKLGGEAYLKFEFFIQIVAKIEKI